MQPTWRHGGAPVRAAESLLKGTLANGSAAVKSKDGRETCARRGRERKAPYDYPWRPYARRQANVPRRSGTGSRGTIHPPATVGSLTVGHTARRAIAQGLSGPDTGETPQVTGNPPSLLGSGKRRTYPWSKGSPDRRAVAALIGVIQRELGGERPGRGRQPLGLGLAHVRPVCRHTWVKVPVTLLDGGVTAIHGQHSTRDKCRRR
jgi:hypothetical protein